MWLGSPTVVVAPLIRKTTTRIITAVTKRRIPGSVLSARRNFAGTKSPGSDPLEILKKECLARNLCDVQGYRMPGVHWVFSIAISPEDFHKPPNLRTVGIERMSPAGIHFVMKRGSPVSESLVVGRSDGAPTPVSMLHVQGKYLPGENVEQWRGEGHCERVPLSEILNYIPHYTITSIVGSKRLAKETAISAPASSTAVRKRIDDGKRLPMMNKHHATEIMQKTRVDLENGKISLEELEDCIYAFRLIPDRLECMIGGPDTSIMWDRWEWTRDQGSDSNLGSISWNEAKQLVPH